MGAIDTGTDDLSATHRGYVAGRYRDGALSDTWTDVTRCAERTFIAYLARCGCGWLGEPHPADPDGYHTCQRDLIRNHLSSIATPRPAGTDRSPDDMPR
jgi:hypothetical protein